MKNFSILAVLAILVVAGCTQPAQPTPGGGTPGGDTGGGGDTGDGTPSGTCTRTGASSVTCVVQAKKWDWTPAELTGIKVGDTVTVKATTLDVPHGFSIPDFGVDQRIEPGQEATITFTASKAGEFTLACSVFCGSGHSTMRGKVVVTAA